MIIPEIKIYNIIGNLVNFVREDYATNLGNSTPNDSILYQIFGDETHLKINLFEEAVSIFTKDQNSPRQLRVRSYYDRERASIPTIHITIPQEQTGPNSIGHEYDYTDISNNDPNALSYRRNIEMGYTSLTYIVVTSDNENEALIIYHTLKAMIQSAYATFEFTGIENVKVSGQEIQLNDVNVPEHIFHRGIGLSYHYEVSVPQWFTENQLVSLITCKFEQDPENSPKLIEGNE